MLSELSDRQSDVRELLTAVREHPDKSIQEGLAGNLGYGDDLIVAVVLAHMEMLKDPFRTVEVMDLIWAGELLDHLDTQGFELRHKED